MKVLIKKSIFICLGCLFCLLGILGGLLPIMPGFVFTFVGLGFFAKGSTRFHSWLTNNKYYKKYVTPKLEKHKKERAEKATAKKIHARKVKNTLNYGKNKYIVISK